MAGKKLTATDKKKITKLATVNNLTPTEISEATGIPRTTVYDEIQRVTASDSFQFFQNNKDKVFEALQCQMIELADADVLKGMVSKRGFVDVAILQDKIQQLRGQETQVNSTQIAVFINSIINRCAKDGAEVCQASETDTNQVIDIPVIDGLLENLKDNK